MTDAEFEQWRIRNKQLEAELSTLGYFFYYQLEALRDYARAEAVDLRTMTDDAILDIARRLP